jgi:IrrE N-terminal-like domain
LKLRGAFADHLAAVEAARPFVPFVGGEAARIERCAMAVKGCLGAHPSAAIDPWAVANGAGIIVHGEEYFDQFSAEDRRQVLEVGASHWSAGTLVAPGKAMIILNPTHDLVRQKATLAEELAHIVMGHPPSSIDPVTGFRTYNRDVEDEAYGVGGAMVLPYGQLFPLARRGVATTTVARRYGLSDRFVNYRINRAGLRRMYRKRAGA